MKNYINTVTPNEEMIFVISQYFSIFKLGITRLINVENQSSILIYQNIVANETLIHILGIHYALKIATAPDSHFEVIYCDHEGAVRAIKEGKCFIPKKISSQLRQEVKDALHYVTEQNLAHLVEYKEMFFYWD